MRILFAGAENAVGGFFARLRSEMPEHHFELAGLFRTDSVRGFDVLIPLMTPITREVLEEGDRLRLIQQTGAGLDRVDLEAARERNIWVANIPTAVSFNAESVAEMGIYLMIGLSRDVRAMARSLAEGKVNEPLGKALCGKTAGLIGLGGIGRALAKRLKAFEMRLVGIKRHDPERAMRELGFEWVGRPEERDELLRRSDYVILCLPLTPESRHLMDRGAFASMKRESFLINLSRGDLVDRDALEEALSSGKIAGAGLDVFWKEPVDPHDAIFNYNVLATPHVAGVTDISIQTRVNMVVENLRRLERNEKPLYVQK
jgi:phosphoglycerate dehydrogenase-like enzyme